MDYEKWNNSIFDYSAKKRENELRVGVFEKVEADHKSIMDGITKEVNRANATWLEKTEAILDVAKENNDFFALDEFLTKQDLSKNIDTKWKSDVENFDNAIQMAQSYGLPDIYAKAISETNNQEEFLHFVNMYNNKKIKDDIISNRIGTSGQIAGHILAGLTGMEMAAGIILPATFIPMAARAARTARNIENAEQASRAASYINRVKTTSQVAGYGTAVAVPMLKSQIHEDYTLQDQLIDTLLFGAIDTAFITTRSINKIAREVDEVSSGFKTKTDVVSVVPKQATKQETPVKDVQVTLDDGTKVSVKQTLFELKTARTRLEKNITSLNKKLDNTRMAKETRVQTLAKLDATKKELRDVSTAYNKIKKSKKETTILKEVDKFKGKYATSVLDDAKTFAKTIDDAVENVAKTSNEAEVTKIAKETLKASGGTKFVAKKNKDGSLEIGVKDKDGKFKPLTKTQKVGAALSVGTLATGTAMADDGQGNWYSDVPNFVAAAFLLYLAGGKIASQIDAHKGLAKAFKANKDSFIKSIGEKSLKRNDPSYRKADAVYNMYDKAMEKMGFIFQKTFNGSDAEGKELAKKLFYGITNQEESTVDFWKHRDHENDMRAFYDTYTNSLKKYKQARRAEEKQGLIQYISSTNRVHIEFNTEIGKAIHIPTGRYSPEVMEVVQTINKLTKSIYKKAEEAKVKGFYDEGTGKFIENYLPRVIKNNVIYSAIKNSDGAFKEGGAAYEALKANFYKMYSAANPEKTSEEIAKTISEHMKHIEESVGSEIRGSVGDVLGDSISMGKARLNLDLSVWEDFKYKSNGKELTFKIEDAYEMDAEQLFTGYSAAMAGHINLAKKLGGGKPFSYTSAIAIAEKQTDPSVRKAFEIGIKMLIGRSTFDTQSDFYQIMRTGANLTAPMFLSLSGIMQIKEVTGTILRSMRSFDEFKLMTTEFKNTFMNRGSDDYITNLAIELTGLGHKMKTNKLKTRVINDIENMTDDQLTSLAAQANMSSQKFRDFAMLVYGIAPLTDFGQRMNGALNINLIANIVNGKTTISKSQMDMIGLRQSDIDKFKSVFKFNDKGNLTKASVDEIKNNPELFDELGRIVFNLNNSQMLQPMVGTTLSMFHASGLGSIFSTLLTFASQSFATYGARNVKGVAKGDMLEVIDAVSWFAAMYVAEQLKAEVKGKQIDDEEAVRRALLNMPVSMPFSLLSSFADPIATQPLDKLEIAATKTSEDLLTGFK